MEHNPVPNVFHGLIDLGPHQKTDKEVLYGIRGAIVRDQKLPFETGVSAALADAVRLIHSLYEENEKLRHPK